MALLCNLPLLQQITYRPPSDAEVTQLEIEAVNRLHLEQAEKQAETDALNLRFELEVDRIRDLNGTGCFWSMMQAADIYSDLMHCLEVLNTTQSMRMNEDLCWMWRELGFTYCFSEQRIDHWTWGNRPSNNGNEEYSSFLKEMRDREISDEEACLY